MTCQRFFKTALMRFLTIRNTADLIRDQFLDVVPDPTRTVDEQYLSYGTHDYARQSNSHECKDHLRATRSQTGSRVK